MHKSPLLLLLVSFTILAWYHWEPSPTEQAIIIGKVWRPIFIYTSNLDSEPTTSLGNIKITNNRGELKEEIKNASGVLLKPYLEKAAIVTSKPGDFNSIYVVCISADSHQVVFSWNELFNTDIGNNVYLITEKNGVKLKDMPERILLISKSDSLSGRRYLKNLKEIRVEQVH